jgi:hypothetical protein
MVLQQLGVNVLHAEASLPGRRGDRCPQVLRGYKESWPIRRSGAERVAPTLACLRSHAECLAMGAVENDFHE